MSKVKVLIFNGCTKSGKTTAEYLARAYINKLSHSLQLSTRVSIMSIVGSIKEIVSEAFGIDPHSAAGRKIVSTIYENSKEKAFVGIWKKLIEYVEDKEYDNTIIFLDVREADDIANMIVMCKNFGVDIKTVMVVRDAAISDILKGVNADVADVDIYLAHSCMNKVGVYPGCMWGFCTGELMYDYILYNNGSLSELRGCLCDFVEKEVL